MAKSYHDQQTLIVAIASIIVSYLPWGIVALTTMIFARLDLLHYFLASLVAKCALLAVGDIAFGGLFVSFRYRGKYEGGEVEYHSENALQNAQRVVVIVPLAVGYLLTLCFGWMFWMLAIPLFVISLVVLRFARRVVPELSE